MPPKGITHEQRYQLCLQKQENPHWKQSQLAQWFLQTYHFSISQPAISHSLKQSEQVLATGRLLFLGAGAGDGVEARMTGVRKRKVRHPELEKAVYNWVVDRQQQKAFEEYRDDHAGEEEERDDVVSGSEILKQARRIGKEMGIEDTVFCPGWLSRFKCRFGIQSRKRGRRRKAVVKGSSTPHISLPESNLSLSRRAVLEGAVVEFLNGGGLVQGGGGGGGGRGGGGSQRSIAVPATMDSPLLMYRSLEQLPIMQPQEHIHDLPLPEQDRGGPSQLFSFEGYSQEYIDPLPPLPTHLSRPQQHQQQHNSHMDFLNTIPLHNTSVSITASTDMPPTNSIPQEVSHRVQMVPVGSMPMTCGPTSSSLYPLLFTDAREVEEIVTGEDAQRALLLLKRYADGNGKSSCRTDECLNTLAKELDP